MHSKIYDFTIPANGVQRLDVVGDLFKVLSSSGSVEVVTDTGAQVTCQAGQGVRGYGFNNLMLRDKSGALNSGTIVVGQTGRGDVIDDRVTGEVSVIDGGKARTVSNTAFWGSASVGVGAYYGTVMLYNNSTTKNLIVESVGVGLFGGVDSSMHLGFLNSGTAGWTVGNAPKSKMSGGANSTAGQIWTNTPGAPIVPYMVDLYCKSNATQILKLAEPIIVVPGYGLCVDCGTPNQAMAANFEFYESPL